jgi:DNA polymerase III subunit beta
MKILCDREKLASAFQTAALFAPSRSPKPILQNVKLEVTKAGAIFMATDMEVGVRIAVEGVEVSKEGTAVLPLANFGAILRESSDEKLQIEASTKGTVVKGERSEFKLTGEDPAEFPAVAAFEEKKYHVIPAPLFKQIILRTEFATDMESSRYALGGVLVELDEKRIIAVGTDGRRLAKMEGPAEAVGGHKTGDTMTIIRTQSMRAIGRALSDNDGQVHVAARGNDVLIRTERAVYYSRLVEGRFPRWRDVFPNRRDAAKIDVTVGPFHSALRQAAVVTNQESRGIDFNFGEGTLTLAASTAEAGQSKVDMPIAYSGPPISVTLDHRFVADFLKVLNPEQTVTIDIENAEAAAVFFADDQAYGYVVMPLSRDR